MTVTEQVVGVQSAAGGQQLTATELHQIGPQPPPPFPGQEALGPSLGPNLGLLPAAKNSSWLPSLPACSMAWLHFSELTWSLAQITHLNFKDKTKSFVV